MAGKKQQLIFAADNPRDLIAWCAPVTITAAEGEGGGPASFDVNFYTGGALEISGWDEPVAVDLSGLTASNVLVANLDHDQSKRVGNFTVANDGKTLQAKGQATAATAARDEVVNSAKGGYQWQASLEVRPSKLEFIKAGKAVAINGQSMKGPLYVARTGVLKGFAFVSHGADDNTTAQIAATAARMKGSVMDPKLKAWIEANYKGLDTDGLSDEAVARFAAEYERDTKPPANREHKSLEQILADKKSEQDRIDSINATIGAVMTEHPHLQDDLYRIGRLAIDEKWDAEKLESALFRAQIPSSQGMLIGGGSTTRGLNNKVVEAAICQYGRLADIDKHYDEKTLDAAHERFRHGIGLKELFVIAAECNGHRQTGYGVDIHTQRAAFGLNGNGNRMYAAGGGFSTLSLPNTLANVANKFLRQGWMAVDQTPLSIAAIRPVSDFKQTTTVSLTGNLMFEQVGKDGEIKHGTIGEEVYNNQADTYARMFSITRTDLINDDLSALTVVPRRVGRGGMLKLNDIFWTEFLNNAAFFAAGNNNVSTDTGALGLIGIQQAETIFMNQVDPDGFPLGANPAILLVPPSIKATALQLMNSQLTITGTDTTVPDANVWRGRFTVYSSPYMENSSYTGYSAVAWYLLADPNDLPVIEIAALNGRVEPIVESADADFNVLGVQMRGYSDVGVALQEYRGGVRADGSAAD